MTVTITTLKDGKLPSQASAPSTKHSLHPTPVKKNILTKGKSKALLSDRLLAAGHIIENLKTEEEALTKLHDLMAEVVGNYFELGGVLLRIKEEGWFGEYKSFEEFCAVGLGFKKSKAYYLITIYEALINTKVPWVEVKKLGWSKLSLVCGKYAAGKITLDDFSKYLESAQKTTYPALAATLKGSPAKGNETKAITFKPHADQQETISAAIVKAKEESETLHDTVALEYICLSYLADPPSHKMHIPSPGENQTTFKLTPNAPDSKEVYTISSAEMGEFTLSWMHEAGPETVLKAFQVAFPDWIVLATPPEGYNP